MNMSNASCTVPDIYSLILISTKIFTECILTVVMIVSRSYSFR